MTQLTLPRAESPLHHADLPALAGQDQKGGLILREERFSALVILRGPDDDPGMRAGVEGALGAAPPTEPCSSVLGDDGTRLLRITPDEWLVFGPGTQRQDLMSRLRSALQGTPGRVVDVSSGYACLHLSGEALADVLKKSTSYDVHMRNFPPGKVVGTTFGKGQAYMLRTDADSVLVIVRRSFADYTWLWLQAAAEEYGLSIAG
ncbi:sarcosine oxidase subunit gamma family protein [Aquisalimonas lutea]|uniref:sarcosine oxidase subunit gamma n=1 Tax=Aquisalimonas lutea TaxID=1327750 RepID=UPI0025B62664|nr:sarcosine oxidase subunit gamma family protein [Aquisalimonas lutea]MDN3519862.1 sarcosine oxidase subunit gamma family protein [Aquisalimonas lutea]